MELGPEIEAPTSCAPWPHLLCLFTCPAGVQEVSTDRGQVLTHHVRDLAWRVAAVSVPLPGGPAGGPRTWGPGLPNIGVGGGRSGSSGDSQTMGCAPSAEPAAPPLSQVPTHGLLEFHPWFWRCPLWGWTGSGSLKVPMVGFVLGGLLPSRGWIALETAMPLVGFRDV